MISVKKSSPDDTTQKIINFFLKRVKKSNLVARKRKTQFKASVLSPLRKKQKALQKIAYNLKKQNLDKLSKI